MGGNVPPFSFSVFVFYSVVPRLSFNFFVPFSVYRSYFLLPFCRSNRTQIHAHQVARRRRRQRSRRMPARERRSRSPQWRQTRFFGCARLSRMRSRLHHHTLTPVAALTHPKTNGAAEVVAVVSVSFTLLTLHVQIQIHSVNAIPRGRNVKRRPISPVFEQLFNGYAPTTHSPLTPKNQQRPTPHFARACASQRYKSNSKDKKAGNYPKKLKVNSTNTNRVCEWQADWIYWCACVNSLTKIDCLFPLQQQKQRQ